MAKAGSGGVFLHSCAVSLLALQLLPAGEGKADFKFLGPDGPILATLGEDALLPCRLSLNLSAEDMELRWYRSRPSPAVYLHRRGAQVSREQMAEYRGRTTFLGDHLARGKAVLRIHNITVYDNGTYHCLFRDGEPHSETTLALQVAGLGLEPRIHVTKDLDKGIRAECTSAGWYPEPHVEWRDFRGYAVPAVTRFSASATTGLLAVLSRVAVPDRSMGGLTCSISSPLLHERKDMILCFSEEDWSLLDPGQTGFYGEFIIGEDCGVSVTPNDPAALPGPFQGEERELLPELLELQGKEAPQASPTDLPALQLFEVEERRKRDELQVLESQAFQQMALPPSTHPAGGGPQILENGLQEEEEEVTIEIVLSSSGDEDSQHSPHGPQPCQGSEEMAGEVPASRKAYVCPACGKAFCWRVNFVRHLRSRWDREKPHVCPVCGKLFSEGEDLDGHLEAHEAQKPYRCSSCERSFRLNSHLLSHRRIHRQPSRLEPEKQSEEGLGFQRREPLAWHRGHTHQKDAMWPFQCRYCIKSFGQNSDLLHHERVHMKRRSKQALNSY